MNMLRQRDVIDVLRDAYAGVYAEHPGLDRAIAEIKRLRKENDELRDGTSAKRQKPTAKRQKLSAKGPGSKR